MLTRLNAVSTFGLLGFMLQHVEETFLCFHPSLHLFSSPERRTASPQSLGEGIQNSQQFPVSFWHAEILRARRCSPLLVGRVNTERCRLQDLRALLSSYAVRQASRPTAGLRAGTFSRPSPSVWRLFHPACNMSHASFACIRKDRGFILWPKSTRQIHTLARLRLINDLIHTYTLRLGKHSYLTADIRAISTNYWT